MQTLPVNVADWEQDPDFPIFPEGSQPKTLLRCPDDLMSDVLVPGHKYLLKMPEGWQAFQIWSEIIAYHLATLCDIDVPRCFPAITGAGDAGALVEFFYGHPRSAFHERFIHGSDLLQRLILSKKDGRPHGVRTNARLCRRYGVANASIEWGKFLTFDALIGNTDRHPDNWGLVWRHSTGHLPSVRMAPAFDNATSLGYEQPERSVSKIWSKSALIRYIGKGAHHCGWSSADDNRGQHMALCARFVDVFPQARAAMRRVIQFDVRELDRILAGCCQTVFPIPFTPTRARFVNDLIQARRSRLADILET